MPHLAAHIDELQFFRSYFSKKWQDCPLNYEYSIKINSQGINRRRYCLYIPLHFLNKNNKEQMDDLVSFISHKEIETITKNHLQKYTGFLGYAIDFNQNPSVKKIYLDCSENAAGIESYEWHDGEKTFSRRIYRPIHDYNQYVPQVVSESHRQHFEKLKKYIVPERALYRHGDNKYALCLALRPDTKISDIQDYLIAFARSFAVSSQDIQELFSQLPNDKVARIEIKKDEISFYCRPKDWIYHL